MNQPSSACGSFINFRNSHRPYAGSRIVQESDLFNEDQPDLQEEIPEWECDGVDFNMRDDTSTGTPFPEAPSNVEYYPGASSTYGQVSRPVPLSAVVLNGSLLVATVGSTVTSPTVVLVNTRVFGDDARAVVLAWINS